VDENRVGLEGIGVTQVGWQDQTIGAFLLLGLSTGGHTASSSVQAIWNNRYMDLVEDKERHVCTRTTVEKQDH
jgi:hypothetical protein